MDLSPPPYRYVSRVYRNRPRDRLGIPILIYFTLGIGITFRVPARVHKPVPIPFPNLKKF